ncbi:MAG: M12 family metallo-peptidase [Planctomycetota bacterium]|nr:M12 family metallo-peptidase [Planctomycetota bacterium]
MDHSCLSLQGGFMLNIRFVFLVSCSLALALCLTMTDASSPPPHADHKGTLDSSIELTSFGVQPLGEDSNGVHLGIDFKSLRASARPGRQIKLNNVPLDHTHMVNLELSPFSVTTPATRFVIGRTTGPDVPYEFDVDSITLLRGRVKDEPGSSVLLILSDRHVSGRIDLGPGRQKWKLTSRRDEAGHIIKNQLSVNDDRVEISLPAGLSYCDSSAHTQNESLIAAKAMVAIPSTQGRRVIDMAVDTDFELFTLAGGNADLMGEYIIKLYASISDIYLRDINTRINLVYVRLWDNENDFYNQPNPLNTLVNEWNNNMGHVSRDVVQLIMGRRDLPYGGVAYLSALCSSSAYSWCGYMMGSVPDTLDSSVNHFDVHVAAHELGHNAGASHTHDYGLDTCNNFNGTPQRGTIMSYCSQTMSGGNALTDLRLHAGVQPFLLNHITSSLCVITDCNDNNIEDVDDITNLISADVNGNGIPDECEDCNENGTLDDQDIASQTSADVDGNLIPDECEPDCNGNTIPDAWDIAMGTSLDLYGNEIPDECETDCNNDGRSDYSELQGNPELDLDRDAMLDACQDCDQNGTPDLAQLDGANSLWVASDAALHLKEFHPISGVRMSTSLSGFVNDAKDVLITDDERVFVTSAGDDRIVEFDRHGLYVGDFVPAGYGGLNYPATMTIGPNGNLFVTSMNSHSVLEYELPSGAFIGVFVAPPPPPPPALTTTSGIPPLINPIGLAFGPNGNLFVASRADEVYEYDGVTGAFVSIFVTLADNGGLTNPRQILFLPNGYLIVASFSTTELLAYDGDTGASLGRFNNGGSGAALTLDEPWGLRMGPDGFLYASRHGAAALQDGDTNPDDIVNLHINSTRIYKYDPDTGDFIRSVVIGNDTGLDGPTGFDFMPGAGFDCNYNMLPDICDIAEGFSFDINSNQVPDECDCFSDVDGSGRVDVFDLLTLLGNWGACQDPCPPFCPGDVNFDCQVNVEDLLQLLSDWDGCGT